jgi:hypothetical protein
MNVDFSQEMLKKIITITVLITTIYLTAITVAQAQLGKSVKNSQTQHDRDC